MFCFHCSYFLMQTEKKPFHFLRLTKYEKEAKELLKSKRETTIIVHVSRLFMSLVFFITCSYYEILTAKFSVVHYIFAFFGASNAYLSVNKWRAIVLVSSEGKMYKCAAVGVALSVSAYEWRKFQATATKRMTVHTAGQRNDEGATINIKRVSVLHWLLYIHKMYASWMFRAGYNHLSELHSSSHREMKRRRRKHEHIACSPCTTLSAGGTWPRYRAHWAHSDCITHKICCEWRRRRRRRWGRKKTHTEPLKRSRKELKNHTERAKKYSTSKKWWKKNAATKNERRDEKQRTHEGETKRNNNNGDMNEEREIFEAKRISNSSRWPVRFYLQRSVVRAALCPLLVCCVSVFFRFFLFVSSCFLFLAFNQRKEWGIFLHFFCALRSFSCFGRSLSLPLSSYVNWIRRCNYGYICIFFDGELQMVCLCIYIYWWSVFTSSKLMECNRFFIFFFSLLLFLLLHLCSLFSACSSFIFLGSFLVGFT